MNSLKLEEFFEFEHELRLVVSQRYVKYCQVIEMEKEFAVVIDRRILAEKGFGTGRLHKLAEQIRTELRCSVWQTV